jgi:hypothetical protein
VASVVNALTADRLGDTCGTRCALEARHGDASAHETPEVLGPFHEPPEVGNATTYWRCADCGLEHVRRAVLDRDSAHLDGCARLD